MKKADNCVIIISLDSLAADDLPELKKSRLLSGLLENGVYCTDIKLPYPTQTYPVHASMITGLYPDEHGLVSNTVPLPPDEKPEWHWYGRQVKGVKLYDAAEKAGIKTASFFWPSAGRSRIRLILPEIMPVKSGQKQLVKTLAAGNPFFILDNFIRYGRLLDGNDRTGVDAFIAASCTGTIKKHRPGLLLVHLLDLDQKRHDFGTRSPEALAALKRSVEHIEKIYHAAMDSSFSRLTLIVTGDHYQKDVSSRMDLNTIFRERGFIRTDSRNRVLDWRIWAVSCDGSAHIYLKDKKDSGFFSYELEKIAAACRGIKKIQYADELKKLRLPDKIWAVLEADDGWYFSHKFSDFPEYRAVHGYHQSAYAHSPLFIASGSGIAKAGLIEKMAITELAPFAAELLGLPFPGNCPELGKTLLKHGQPPCTSDTK